MTFTEAAAEVLRIAGKPLHYKEITELAIEKNLLSHVGKSPEVTMGARLAALLKKEDKSNPIVRMKPGVFALRDWSEKKKGGKEESDEAGNDVNALEVEAATKHAIPDEDEDDDAVEVSGDDALRANLAASGAELFDDEDDDDQPIFGAPQMPRNESSGAQSAGAPGEGGVPSEGGRRRRRRRRRGRGGRDEFGQDRASGTRLPGVSADGMPIQPNAILSVDGETSVDGTRDPLAPPPRPMVRERHQIMGHAATNVEVPIGEGDELAGRELSDATVMVLSAFDRNQGPVPMRHVAEALMRRGRLPSDTQTATSQLSACLRADNLRRSSQGQRPRFRFAQGPRVALTDWYLNPDLVRLEQEALAAVERYRDASRKAMLRKLQELPGHAFIELVLMGLEKAGMTNIRGVRRQGSPGGEVHFAAVHRTGSDEIRTAIVIRKDGRELGRERVSDLRGALHHYGPANAGWLITLGQVLSGARDEAQAVGAAPIALFDGVLTAKLLEDNDVGVVRTRLTTAIPDLELLETLRG